MEQRFISQMTFSRRGGLLRGTLDEVDPELLLKAVRDAIAEIKQMTEKPELIELNL